MKETPTIHLLSEERISPLKQNLIRKLGKEMTNGTGAIVVIELDRGIQLDNKESTGRWT